MTRFGNIHPQHAGLPHYSHSQIGVERRLQLDNGLVSIIFALELCKDKWAPLREHYKIDKAAILAFTVVAKKYPTIKEAYEANKPLAAIFLVKIYPFLKDLSAGDKILLYQTANTTAIQNSEALQLVVLQQVLKRQLLKLEEVKRSNAKGESKNRGIPPSKNLMAGTLDLKLNVLLFRKHHRFPGYLWSWAAIGFGLGCVGNVVEGHSGRVLLGILVVAGCLYKARESRKDNPLATERAASWRNYLKENENQWARKLMSSKALADTRAKIQRELDAQYESILREPTHKKKREGARMSISDELLTDLFQDKEDKINERGLFVECVQNAGAELLYFQFDVEVHDDGVWDLIGRVVTDAPCELSEQAKSMITDHMEAVADDLYQRFEASGLDPQMQGDYKVVVAVEE